MKNLLSYARLLTGLGALSMTVGYLGAAESNTAPADATAPAPSVSVKTSNSATTPTASPARLPAAAAEVIKLTQAQVNEDVIISYVQNSGSTSGLSSDDLIRLRKEGVSDRVINAMLDQHKHAVEVAQINTAPAPVYTDNGANSTPPITQPAPADISSQPAVEAPLTPPASSVYVIPYSPSTPYPYAYYGSPYYYPPYYYGGYYGGPVVSFRFGFGGGHHFHHHGGRR